MMNISEILALRTERDLYKGKGKEKDSTYVYTNSVPESKVILEPKSKSEKKEEKDEVVDISTLEKVDNKTDAKYNKILSLEKPLPLSLLTRKNLPPETSPPCEGKFITKMEELLDDPDVSKVIMMMCPVKRKNLFKREVITINVNVNCDKDILPLSPQTQPLLSLPPTSTSSLSSAPPNNDKIKLNIVNFDSPIIKIISNNMNILPSLNINTNQPQIQTQHQNGNQVAIKIIDLPQQFTQISQQQINIQPAQQLIQPQSQFIQSQPTNQQSQPTIQQSQPIQSQPIQQSFTLIIKPQIDQKWSILDVALRACPTGWENVFQDALPELIELNNILIQKETLGETFYPLKMNIFKAFEMCALNNVKVVIIGQDPYYTTDWQGFPIAQGASFSVSRTAPIPMSLRNIFTEIERTIPGFMLPNHGDLSEWMRQGVLLLNTCLTVKAGEAGSHYKKGNIWLGFLGKVLRAICSINPKCVYMLWGREAEKIEPMLTGRPNVLKAPHPSGRSAYLGFFGCNHFVEANKILISQGKIPIDWSIRS